MLSKAAMNVLRIDMVLTVLPAIKEVILATAVDVSREDDLGEPDPFFRDEVASVIIKELCDFLTQSEVIVEQEYPLVAPSQLKNRYFRAWFGISKKSK